METDSSVTGEKAEAPLARQADKGQEVEEVGTSRARSPPHKRQKTVTSEAEVIGEEQLLEQEIPYGRPDKSKTRIKVLWDSVTSSDFSEVSQAITVDSSQVATERSLKAREIRDKY